MSYFIKVTINKTKFSVLFVINIDDFKKDLRLPKMFYIKYSSNCKRVRKRNKHIGCLPRASRPYKGHD